MKLSPNTIEILKNFAQINQGIQFKPGTELRTITTHRDLYAEATIEETIPDEFCIYDLNSFLSVLSLYKDGNMPELKLRNKDIIIAGLGGRSEITYRACDVSMIVAPPDKRLKMPSKEVTFTLAAEDFDWIQKASNVLAAPDITIKSDGKRMFLVAYNAKDNSSHTNSVDIGEGDGSVYNINYESKNLVLLPGSYDVEISMGGMSLFKHKTKPIKYYVATGKGTHYSPKK